jgi:myo-inositol-1(or 4)-monophosphatase
VYPNPRLVASRAVSLEAVGGLERLREIAREAALVGGRVVLAGRAPREGEGKGLPGDWVTSVDMASEKAIDEFLAGAAPAIPFHGEETGGVESGLRWVVDPLDGTTNFVHGFFAVGVSVALVEDESVLAGAVHAPYLGDVWHAASGMGAIWERPGRAPEACRVGARPAEEAVVATGFPFRRKENLPRYLSAMASALDRFEDLRRPGAACLDLAWTACGVFDGFFELGLSAWDVAAGGLIVSEAGGVVSDWSGGDSWLSGDILAGSPTVHGELRSVCGSESR